MYSEYSVRPEQVDYHSPVVEVVEVEVEEGFGISTEPLPWGTL